MNGGRVTPPRNGGPPLNMRLFIKPYGKADLARTLREVLDG
jgi:hypothetical protein